MLSLKLIILFNKMNDELLDNSQLNDKFDLLEDDSMLPHQLREEQLANNQA